MPATPAAALSLADLRFDDPTTAARHQQLRALAQERGATWTHVPLKRGGSFVRESWCRGSGACNPSKLVQDAPWDAAWINLNTMAYGNKFPEVFGLAFSAGRLDGEWGARISLSLHGRKINGSHYTAVFYEPGEPSGVERLRISDHVSTKVADTELQWSLPGTKGEDADAAAVVDATVAQVLASPDGLRTVGLTMIDGVHAARSELLASGGAYRCEYDLSQSVDGTPPPCERIPLSAEEHAAWGARIDEEARVARALLGVHGEALHAALVTVLPVEAWGS